jgi:microcystin-dependent protein
MSEPFIGQIVLFAGNFAPRGWAFCDGQLLPIAQNDALFSILGTTYGGDGRTTFGLPDLRGRVPLHPGTGPSLTMRRLGEKGGAESASLTVNQLPAHSHPVQARAVARCSSKAGNADSPKGAYWAGSSEGDQAYHDTQDTELASDAVAVEAQVGNSGGGQPVATMPPFQGVHFIIALQGIYPSTS